MPNHDEPHVHGPKPHSIQRITLVQAGTPGEEGSPFPAVEADRIMTNEYKSLYLASLTWSPKCFKVLDHFTSPSG
jgi:hypothetical protein